MPKKKNIILIAILLVSFLGFYGFKNYAKKVKDKHCLTTQISSKVFDFNTFNLKVDVALNLSDFKVVNQNSGEIIFANGKSNKGIKNEYGYCTFELYWKENKVYVFGHFKSNSWHKNRYTLTIELRNNKLEPSLEIYGADHNKADLFFRKLSE